MDGGFMPCERSCTHGRFQHLCPVATPSRWQ